LVLVAANADSVSVALSHFESFRVLPERRLPTVRRCRGKRRPTGEVPGGGTRSCRRRSPRWEPRRRRDDV